MGPLPKPGALGSPVGGDKGSPSWDLVGLGVVRVFKKNGKNWELSGNPVFVTRQLLVCKVYILDYIYIYKYIYTYIYIVIVIKENLFEWYSSRAVSAMYECSTIAGVETTHDPNHCLNPT